MEESYEIQEPSMTRREFLEKTGKAFSGALIAGASVSITDKILEGSEVDKESTEYQKNIENLMEQAQEKYKERYKTKKLEDSLQLYEKINEIQGNTAREETELERKVKNKIAQLYLERSFTYYINNKVNLISNPQIKNWFEKSKKYGIESLKLNENFAEKFNGRNYRKAIKELNQENYNQEDLTSMLVYAHGIAGSKFYGGSFEKPFKQLRDVRDSMSSYKKVKELDKNFFGGNALSTLGGAYTIINSYSWEKLGEGIPLGKEFLDLINIGRLLFPEATMEKGEDLIKESIEENKDFLLNRVIYGGLYATSVEKENGEEIYEKQLSKVLKEGEDQEVREKWPLWNRVATTLADDLLRSGYEYTRKYYQSLI